MRGDVRRFFQQNVGNAAVLKASGNSQACRACAHNHNVCFTLYRQHHSFLRPRR